MASKIAGGEPERQGRKAADFSYRLGAPSSWRLAGRGFYVWEWLPRGGDTWLVVDDFFYSGIAVPWVAPRTSPLFDFAMLGRPSRPREKVRWLADVLAASPNEGRPRRYKTDADELLSAVYYRDIVGKQTAVMVAEREQDEPWRTQAGRSSGVASAPLALARSAAISERKRETLRKTIQRELRDTREILADHRALPWCCWPKGRLPAEWWQTTEFANAITWWAGGEYPDSTGAAPAGGDTKMAKSLRRLMQSANSGARD